MVDDEYRGYLMELLATKLLTLQQDIQIVGMSATLSVSQMRMYRNDKPRFTATLLHFCNLCHVICALQGAALACLAFR